MSSKNKKKRNGSREPVPDVNPGLVHGAFATQAVTDTTHRFPRTNVARPSDECVEANRDWVDFNEK